MRSDMIESRSIAEPGVSVLSLAWLVGAMLPKIGSDPIIDLFNPVVASLVVLIDVAFDLRDLSIRDIHRARDVFFVP